MVKWGLQKQLRFPEDPACAERHAKCSTHIISLNLYLEQDK